MQLPRYLSPVAMGDKEHLPPEQSAEKSGLSRHAPVRESLRKRIWKSLRLTRSSNSPGSSRSLQDLNPDGRKHKHVAQNASDTLALSPSSSDSSVLSGSPVDHRSPSYRRVINHGHRSKTASLDRVLTRPRDTIPEDGKVDADEADKTPPSSKLRRSRSLRERTGRMFQMVRRGVGHHKRSESDNSRHHESEKNVSDGHMDDSHRRLSLDANRSPAPDARHQAVVSVSSGDDGEPGKFAGKSQAASHNGRLVVSDSGSLEGPRAASPQRFSLAGGTGYSTGIEILSRSPGPVRRATQTSSSSSGTTVAGYLSKKLRGSRPKLSGAQQELYLWSPAKVSFLLSLVLMLFLLLLWRVTVCECAMASKRYGVV